MVGQLDKSIQVIILLYLLQLLQFLGVYFFQLRVQYPGLVSNISKSAPSLALLGVETLEHLEERLQNSQWHMSISELVFNAFFSSVVTNSASYISNIFLKSS